MGIALGEAREVRFPVVTYIPRKAIVPVSRSGGCHFLPTYRSASCAQNTEHIRVKNITVVLHINTKQSAKFELYAGKHGQATSLTKLVSQGAVDDCTRLLSIPYLNQTWKKPVNLT